MSRRNNEQMGEPRARRDGSSEYAEVMPVRDNRYQQAAGGFVPASASGSKRSSRVTGVGATNQYARTSMAYQGKKHGMSGGKKVLIAILIIAVVAAVAGVGVYAYAQMKKSEINEGLHDMDVEVLEAVDAEVTGKATITEPFTVLLLGSDAREDDPDMGARTDTIILVRVDPVENNVAMVSIPRDTKVQVDGVGTTKINSAYSYGGPGGTIAVVKELTGVEIDHYAEVNFASMEGLVDAIGGIDIYLEEEIDDEDAGGYVPGGQQHLNGEQALVVARSRAYADGDYTRQANQRKVILAIIDRVLNAPASEMTGLISASTDFVTTDSGISVDFLISLAQQMRDNGNNGKPLNIVSATIPSRPAYIDDVSYVIADTAGIQELMRIFLSGGDVSQPIEVSSIDDDVANAGGSYTSSGSGNSSDVYGGATTDYGYGYGYGQSTGYADTGYVDQSAYAGTTYTDTSTYAGTTTYDATATGGGDAAGTGGYDATGAAGGTGGAGEATGAGM